MKIAFVSYQKFERRMNTSTGLVFELAKSLQAGDILSDIVTGEDLVVAGVGFSRRSPETVDVATWSREASIAFRGDASRFIRRLIWSGKTGAARCLDVNGSVKEKNGLVPVNIPISGVVRTGAYDSPALLLINEEFKYHLLFIEKPSAETVSGELKFICANPDRDLIEIVLTIDSAREVADSGPLMVWEEHDSSPLLQ